MDFQSRPSAPLYPVISHANSGDHLLSRQPSSSAPAPGEKGLVKDVMKRAHGDDGLAGSWLTALGVRPAGWEPLEDLDVAAAEAGAPGQFFCPISYAIMRDPVLLTTGQTFERQSIEEWLVRGHNVCPSTRQLLELPVVLTPNFALRNCIEEWAEKNALWLLGPDGRIKPVPEAERLPTVQKQHTSDADLALAVRLQEDELSYASAQRPPRSPSANRRLQGAGLRPRERRRASTRHTWPLRLLLYGVTIAGLALCVLSFWQNGWQVENLHDNPMIGAGADALRALGSKSTGKILQPDNQWWRLVSSAFLPSGILTLFAMLETLWTFALHLDPVLLGPSILSIPFVYLVSAIVGGLASANLARSLDACGGSAGACGLLGFMWAEQFLNWRRYRHHCTTVLVLAVNTALFIILGFLPLMDNFYHILAMGTGALLAPALLSPQMAHPPEQRQAGRRRSWCCLRGTAAMLCLAVVAALLAVGVVGLIMKRADVSQSCRWCPDFACIDTRWWDCLPELGGNRTPSCVYTPHTNGTATVRCSAGNQLLISASGSASANSSSLVSVCNTYCNTVTVGADSAMSPPPPATTVIRASGR